MVRQVHFGFHSDFIGIARQILVRKKEVFAEGNLVLASLLNKSMNNTLRGGN